MEIANLLKCIINNLKMIVLYYNVPKNIPIGNQHWKGNRENSCLKCPLNILIHYTYETYISHGILKE